VWSIELLPVSLTVEGNEILILMRMSATLYSAFISIALLADGARIRIRARGLELSI